MPEDLPTLPDSIQQLKAREKKKKKLDKPTKDELRLLGDSEGGDEGSK